MLVLSRKYEQSIMIGDDIEIKVFRISPFEVRLGIEAPRSVSIWRGELYEEARGKKRKTRRTTHGSN